MQDKMEKAGRLVVDLASSQKIEAEAYVLHDSQLTIEVVDGKIETLKEAEEIGIGVRVIDEQRLGFAYTTDLSPSAVKNVFAKALENARYASPDPNWGLPEPADEYPRMDLVAEELKKTPLADKIEMAIEIERCARRYDKRITVVERTGYEDSLFEVLIMNTRGLNIRGQGGYCGIFAFLVAEDKGMAETGFAMMSRRNPKDLKPSAIGEEAAFKAVRMLGAKRIGSKRMPVIFEPYVAASFLSLVANAVNADSVQKGKSFLAGRLGEEVASPAFSLVDDQLLTEAIGAFPFDGEGTPAARTVVIDKGKLVSFLYDQYTAAREGRQSTGNGTRSGFRSLPGVGTTNFVVSPGEKSLAELIAEVDDGMLVTEVMGMHTANPISGDFSLGITGVRIEGGKLTYPVRGITMAGNLVDLLKDIEAVGSDLTFFGSDGSPSIRLKAVSLGGE